MSQGQVLQEYLLKLGYQTDIVGFKKFDAQLSGTSKKILGVGAGITGIVAATTAATAAFSYNMRKMYFASELANSSVKNRKGMEYAGEQIGVAGDSMQSAIQGMAQSLRLEPGLQAFLQNMGIQVSGRDVSDVMVDLVSALHNMPEFQASQIAGMFGISPDDYHQMATHLDDLKAKKQEHAALFDKMNADMDASKKVVQEYTGELDKMGAMFDVIEYKLLDAMLPAFRDASKYIEEWMGGVSYGLDHLSKQWQDFIGDFSGEALSKKWEQFKQHPIESLLFGYDDKEDKKDEKTKEDSDSKTAASKAPSTYTKSKEAAKEYLADLGSKFSLPDNLLYKVFGVESAYGSELDSPKGAQGPFQFMPETAKDMGLNNPYDFEESAGAAAKMYKRLLKKYNNSTKLAAGAYNWGEGNIDSWLKTGAGKKGQPMPKETKDYMEKVGGGYDPIDLAKKKDEKREEAKNFTQRVAENYKLDKEYRAKDEKPLDAKNSANVLSPYLDSLDNKNSQADYMANINDKRIAPEVSQTNANATITNNNTYNITGNDSKQIADNVVNKQDRVNADTVRQFKVVFQ